MNNTYLNSSKSNNNPTHYDNIPVANQTNEESYIENILNVNKGKKVSIYQSFVDAEGWKSKVFTGIIEQSGKDHLVLSDPVTGKWYLLLMIYVNYIEFDENINTLEQFYPYKV